MADLKPLPVSVVVADTAGPQQLERCLEALLPQIAECGGEIVTVGASMSVVNRIAAGSTARVSHAEATADATLPRLLGLGLARARGEVVAVTESCCIPQAGWVAAALQGLPAGEARVLGGAIEPTPDLDRVSHAAFLLEYGQFMLPLRPGSAEEIAGDNFALPRAALPSAEALQEQGFWKTFEVNKLARSGYALTNSPEMIVVQDKRFCIEPFLVRRYHHGRCFAGMRAQSLSPLGRVGYLLASPALPILFLSRLVRRLVPKRRSGKRFVSSLPVMLLGIVSWSIGETVGYLRGPGGSCVHVR